MIELSVIFVLFNEFELSKQSLDSIYKQEVPNMEVILVDNSSDRKGYKNLISRFPKVKYLRSPKNLGFAGGVNLGLEKAKGEYVLVFTPDMLLLPGTIKKSIDYLKTNKKIGLLSGRLFTSPKNQERSASFNYPNLLSLIYYYNMPFYKLIRRINSDYLPNFYSKKDHDKVLHPKTLRGEYMFFRKKAVEEIGNFDTQFFLYFEDYDLCRRLTDKGWRIEYVPFGGVIQNGVTSWKKTNITQSYPIYLTSQYRFFLKYNGKPYTLFAYLVVFLSSLISIPYLITVYLIKFLFLKKSQSKELIPIWFGIAKWHLTEGVSLIFK